ncbi:General transcription factor 3C polypeptide 1 [Channa argus]|uniref:General transcription factor 3C polypeptide 1 n=1 Tax=Channa argus TaxID=215402 RepID=A0A6G1PD24_CHAAH|nr:General transcription factor 3C polypeptide 1 [Channa argus]
MDPLGIVADEVALEGLDGITIPSLWIRLEDREPKFSLKLDEFTKEYIWRSLVINADLTFYVLPQEREAVVLSDRYKDIDPDTGIETTETFSEVKKEIYPVHIIVENKDGIQGSCALFSERKDVTKHIRSKSLAPLVNLKEALERYGQKLVVVASQTLRFRALIGSESDPDLKLTDESYCLLERLGRARWQGELQSDLHGNSFKTDARKLHYIRKSLVKHGLIGMQSHVTRLKSRQQQQHSILLHLNRFHILRRSKYDILMESMSNLVQQFPGQFATLPILKEQLNLDDRTFKQVLNYMRAAKLIQLCNFPLEDLDPSAGPCNNKNGSKVLVRCLKLLKPYTRKGVADEDYDDEEEEGDNGKAGKRGFPSEGRIMEKDVLSQAYHLVLSCGTKGIPQTVIGFRMNIGKLESRMICRTLEREGVVSLFLQGFMVDEGRQRTTKYISHKFVGVSDQLQLFAQERKKLLHSSTSQTSDSAPAPSETPSTSNSNAAKKKSGRGGDKDAKDAQQICDAREEDTATEGLDEEGGETPACSKSASSVTADPVCDPSSEKALVEEQEQFSLGAVSHLPQSEDLNAPGNLEDSNLAVVKDVDQLQIPSQQNSRKSLERCHETYRLLKRKNLIVEAIHNLKIVEGLFPLQKIINDNEKQDGVSSKCCRKTVLRLVNSLRREGLLKMYTTTVIQDGITKKVDMVAHPTVQPNDDAVNRVIEQVRFRISSSYSAVRLHQDKAGEENKNSEDTAATPKAQKSKAEKRRAGLKDNEKFKPKTVKGLGKTFGFQPKMHRLRVVHNFLWKYLFSFHENLQKLVYMGLLQFAPVEKFKEKDQVFVYLKCKATIIDTTVAEPHYWLVTESQEKPFERRQYIFNTAEDVENYWFDLMCVCLNTPLGVFRGKRNDTEEESAPSFVHERNVFVGLAYLLKGSSEVCDNGSIPGDGKGAGGLHSEFFAHLKRNWLWTNHLLAVKKNPTGSEEPASKVRLRSLLTKNALRIALKAGGTTAPRYITTKQPVMAETIELAIESASRNEQVVGGKRQKRKRTKKEVVKVQRKKKKEPKPRTPAHDEADHQALKMMTRQRVYWSVQEDSLMMLCCVASHLLNGKLKRPFVAHCVVRDLLHAEFDISIDKTSVAVGRRSRYILKNPQTLLNYRICLAEVYQDKTLSTTLEEKKPADPEKPEDCAAAFSEYVRLLRLKFSSVASAHEMIMPDTKQELFSQFKVSTIYSGVQVSCKDTLNCTDDIHAIVLHNLIQSTLAMTNGQMKSLRSFQTFHMYSKYNQEVLCKVFIKCKKRGLVNRRRVNKPFGPRKNRSLPILPMSFQLSQTYYRCFSWRFPYSLCTDSFHFLRSLLNSGERDDRPVTAFYHETENRAENGEEVLERKRALKRKAKQREGNEDGTQVSELGGETSPESTKGGKNEMEGRDKSLEVDVNKSSEQKKTEDCQTAVSSHEQTGDHVLSQEASGDGSAATNAAPQVTGDPPDISDMLQFSMDSPGGACVASLSLMSVGLLSVYISIPKQIVVVDSTLVDNDVIKSMAALEEEDDDDYDGEECERAKKVEVKAHQASHTNYLVMRGYCSPGIVKLRNLNTNDNIVVESCIMRLQLRSTPAHHIFSMENSPPLDLTKCGASLLPSILTYSISSFFSPPTVEECDRRLIQQRGYTPQDIEACAQLRRRLNEAGENGVDIYELYEAHTHLEEPESGCSRSVQQYMKDLQEEGQVSRVGGLGERWVLIQHAEPWLLTLNSKQRPQSHVISDRLPFLKSQHNIPFMRKRCWQGVGDEAEEPPAKKPPVDRQGNEDAEDLEKSFCDATTQKLDGEKQQEERSGASNGDKLNIEGEKDAQKQSREEGDEEVATETRPKESRQLSDRKDTTGSADLDDE